MNIETDIQQFGATVASDVKAWAGEAETFVITEGEAAWNAVSPILKALPAEAWAALRPIAVKAVAAVANNDFADEETALLNMAESAGVTILRTLEGNLGSAIIQALLAAAKI